MASVQEANRK